MIEKIILKKSAVLDKMPAAEQLDFGELAINYNAEHPFLSFKDSDGNITALNDYADAIKKKLNISDFNTFKEYITNGIEAFGMNMVEALKTKADKTELNAYAKLSDTEQTILANKLKADDLILKGFSLNGLIDVMNNNINRNTSYIGNLDLQKVDKSDITQSTGTSETAVMSQKAVSDALSNVYTKAESDAMYLRGDWELISEVSEYDTSKNKITVAENCDGYKELAVRRTNNNTLSNTNVYLDVNGHSISLQGLSSQKKDAVWHVVQDGNNLSVKFLYYNFVNTGRRLYYASSTNEYYINCKIGGKVELNFYNLTTLHDGENIKVYGKR